MPAICEARVLPLMVMVAAAMLLQSCSSREAHQPRAAAVRGTWPMYQYKPDHNAVIPGNDSAAWTYDAKARINGGLALVDGVLFLDTFDARIVALDARSGSVRWEAKTDNIVMSTPIIADGAIFVGTGHNGGLHSESGSFAYTARGGNGDPPLWGREEGDHVLAFDAATGTTRWSYRTAGEDMPSAAYVDGRLVFANGDFHAYGLSARDGSALWRREIAGIATMASAVATQQKVFLGSCGRDLAGRTTAVDASSGRVLWSAPLGDCDASPTVANGQVFVSGVDGNMASFGYGGRAYAAALDARSGKLLWKYESSNAGPFTRLGSNERAIAGVYADGLYIASFATDSAIVAVDAASGKLRWRSRTAGPVKMSPIVLDHKVYFGDTVGVFYVLDERNGKLQSTHMFEQPFATAPCIAFGRTIYLVNGTKVVAMPTERMSARHATEPDTHT